MFLTAVNCIRDIKRAGPDKFWRVQQFLRFSMVRRGEREHGRYYKKIMMYVKFEVSVPI